MHRLFFLPLQLLILLFLRVIGAPARAQVPGASAIDMATAGNAQATMGFAALHWILPIPIFLSGLQRALMCVMGRVQKGTVGRLPAMLVMLLALLGAGPVAGANWAANYGTGAANAVTQATAVDAAGNTYIAGYFNGATLALGSVTLSRIGAQDAFVAKLDTSGAIVWAKNYGGVGATAAGNGIAVDASGNVYLGGYFNGANLTTPALTKTGTQDAFALKLDSLGATTWSKNYGGVGATATGNGIAVDTSSNVYLGGYFNAADLTTPALTKIGTQDAFALKLDSLGATTWSKNYGGSGASAFGTSIAVDASSNVYLGGYFAGANLTTPALTKIGTQDAFALKLASSGTTTWSKNYGGSGASAFGTSIAVDASSNVYLGGYFNGANLTTPALTRIGTQDDFTLQLTSAGATTWSKNYGGSGASAFGNGIAVDASGNVYLGGYFISANLTTPALTKIGTQDASILKQVAAYVPGAPTAVAAAAGNTQATVTFTAPVSNGGSAITGYTVTSSPVGGTDSNAGSTGLSHVVTGLTNGTLYTFTVTATNAAGTSALSTASSSVTPATVPGAPTIGTATAGNTQVTVTFTAPASTGGSAITGYTVTSSPAGGTDSNAGTTGLSHIVTGLTNGTAYTFTVTATNVMGTGAASGASSSETPATVPGAPSIGTATTGNTQATVTFTAPASTGGSAITGYTVTSSPVGGTDSNAGTTGLSHVVTGLTNGTAYTFTVKATNLMGTGAASGATNSVTPATVPGAPSIGTATAGNTQATVTFTAPASTGGSAITGYTVTSSPAGGTDSNALTTGLSHVVTGLTNGLAYTFTVTATNSAGTGVASGATNSVTPSVSQTITFNAAPTVVVGGTGTVSATGGASGNAVTFSSSTTSVCTISGNTVSGVAAGTCTIAADQAGGATYSAAPQVTQSITIGKGSQTITFGVQAGKVFGVAPFQLSPLATASSGLAVTYTSSTTAVCTIAGSTVTIVTVGTCTVAANQAVSANYNAAPQVTQDIVIGQGSQAITFGGQAAKSFGATPFPLSPLATASSGLAVTYTSNTLTVCTIAGNTVTIVAVGTCTIAVNQAGNANYTAAPQVTQNIIINPPSQTITFGAQAGKPFGAVPFPLSPLATVNSSLTVSYTSTTPLVCTISGTIVTIVAAGTCTIAANQAGNGNYNAATQVTQNIVISQGTQTITFGSQTGKTFGASPFPLNPLATASSGLAVIHTSTTLSVCTIGGTTVTIVAPGTCTIAANQAGNATYGAAPQLTQDIVIGKGTQTIAFGAQAAQIIGVAPFPLNPVATASSGLDVSYSSTTATVCTISGTTVTALAVGACIISVSQAGNGNYSPAVAVTQSITIGKPTAPGAPTLTGVTAGFGSATVSFDAPSSSGGSTITSYTASCTATGQTTRTGTGSAPTSMIIVQGLTINVTYSCSVTASNSVGSGTASAALPVIPAATYAIPTTSSSLTGLWWNENESGWGMSVTQHGTMIFVGWYNYDQSGAPTWYVMPSCPILGNACTGDIYAVSGGKSFVRTWDGSAKVVTKVGSGILTFINANAGAFNFSINGVPGLKSITRQVFASGSTAPNPDFSDIWWNPNESGWGVTLSQQYGTIFAAMFGYDAIGNPIWYVASNCKVSGNSCSGDLFQVMGGTRPTTTWNGAGLVVSKVGFIEFVFADSSNGTMNFFINGVAGTKVITRQSF